MAAETEHTTEHVPEWKKEEVAALVEVVDSYDSVGVVDVTGIPSRQLQQMRADLYGTAVLRMGRNTLVRRALDEVDEGVEVLAGEVSGQVGIVGTNANPFALYRKLEESKTPAPIGAGETAPNDIVIEAGDTGMDPGPFVGDLQTVGANARIQEGSIQVLEDSVVCEAGEEVSADLAGVLGELGMEPKEVGLDLRAVFSDGVLFEPDELAIDVEEYRTDVRAAAARARNLSVNAAYPTEATAGTLIGKALGEAKSLGLRAAIESPDIAGDLVGRADAQLRALAASIDDEDALPEELRGVEAPPSTPAAATQDAESTDERDETEEADEAEADADADEAAAADEEDDEPSGEGLGDLFG